MIDEGRAAPGRGLPLYVFRALFRQVNTAAPWADHSDVADDPIPPMPDWVPRLWTRGEGYRRLLGVLESLEPHEARALLLFLRDHEEAYRPVLPPTSDTPY